MEDPFETTTIEIATAVLFGSLMLALIGVFVFLMVIIYQKRKIEGIRVQQQLIAEYEQAVLKAKVEMREETLRYVGLELHDNVGQVLSLAKLYLSQPDTPHKSDARLLVDQAIKDIRLLSHDLNINRVEEQYSLSRFIRQELNKVQKTGLMKVTYESCGSCDRTSAHNRLMISRIFQECINNILKHADAKHIFVKLISENGACTLVITDDGTGFDTASVPMGTGLVNIYDRVKLIHGSIDIVSSPGNGTNISIRIPQG